ncbi:tissue factor pathway inhibitor-like [Haliotis asinina]|uniref:tissue factor pathway inhibitor-like n=1 Tax=Haliotis asinina TaxID=109174 RepID=UPI003531C0A3
MKLIGIAILFAMSAQAKDDLCDLPPEQGYCRGYFRRYYFDEATQRCVDFIFGGCGGNRNNFVFLEHCQEMCEGDADDSSSTKPSLVSTTTNFTDTSGNVTFDSDLDSNSSTEAQNRTAEVSIEDSDNYTSENTSETLNATTLTTEADMNVTEEDQTPDSETSFSNFSPSEPDPSIAPLSVPFHDSVPLSSPDCASLPERGLCRGLFVHFFYNPVRERCEEFIYGGCGGNGNNYQQERLCRKACFKPVNMHAAATLKSTSSTSDKSTSTTTTHTTASAYDLPVTTVTKGTSEQTTSGAAGSSQETSFEDLIADDTTEATSFDSKKPETGVTDDSIKGTSPDTVIQDSIDNAALSGNDTTAQNLTEHQEQTDYASEETTVSKDGPGDELDQWTSGTAFSSGKPTTVSAQTPKEATEGVGITQVAKASSSGPSSTDSTTT